MKETVFLSPHLWLWDNGMTLYCRRKSWNVTSIKYKSLRHHLTYSFQYFIRFNLDAIACNIQTSYCVPEKCFIVRELEGEDIFFLWGIFYEIIFSSSLYTLFSNCILVHFWAATIPECPPCTNMLARRRGIL